MVDELGPCLDLALRRCSRDCGVAGIELRPLLGAALSMGDDGHNRCKALTALLQQASAAAISADA